MAMVVMAIIIILNIVLLLAVIRIGTQGEHHSRIAPEQSGAVRAWRERLGISAVDRSADASEAAADQA